MFPNPVRLGGAILGIVSLVLIVSSYGVSLVGIAIGAWLSLSKEGVEINPAQKTIRSYQSLLGIKQGKWESYTPYTDISILQAKTGYQGKTRGGVDLSNIDLVYDINILTPDHRSRLSIKRYKVMDTARQELPDLAQILGLKVARYNPVVSAGTRGRR